MTLDDILTTWSRADVLQLAGLSLLTVLLWRVPVLGWLFYPFRLLNTFVHEISHGLTAVLTGGQFHRFVVHPNREGVAHIRGGNRFLVISSGYLGPAVFGGLLILLTGSTIAAQTILLGLGVGFAMLCLLFVRNLFGMTAGMVLAVLLIAAGWYLADPMSTLVLALLAMQMPLSAVNNLVDLVRLSMRPAHPDQLSDAELMARYTRVPAFVWAVAWCLVALVIIVLTVALAYRDMPVL